MATGGQARDLGKVQWSYLSSVMHVTWYGISQAVVEGPAEPGGLGPSMALVGMESKAVNTQSLCLLRCLRQAGAARMTMMGWLDDDWVAAEHASKAHENALLGWIISTS
jgi:hypothetical protein